MFTDCCVVCSQTNLLESERNKVQRIDFRVCAKGPEFEELGFVRGDNYELKVPTGNPSAKREFVGVSIHVFGVRSLILPI